jgi:hypothetical protein
MKNKKVAKDFVDFVTSGNGRKILENMVSMRRLLLNNSALLASNSVQSSHASILSLFLSMQAAYALPSAGRPKLTASFIVKSK